MASLQAWALMIISLVTTSQPEIFHIIPSADSHCPGRLTGEPCFTLSQFISGEYRQYTSGPSEIVLEFQPGHHTAGYSNTFASQLVSFTMNSLNSTEIYCLSSSLYRIDHVRNVHIKGIDFVRCSYRIESVASFTLENSSFSRTRSYPYYALHVRSSLAIIKGCTFTNNYYRALDVDNSSVEVHNTSFTSNGQRFYERINVGALAVQNAQSIVIISQCNFVDNSNPHRGGAIFTNSSLFIQRSRFVSNRVVYTTAGEGGGAICVIGSNISVSINQSEFANNRIGTNQAGNGGAVYVSGDNTLVSIQQSTIRNSIAGGSGGAVYVSGNNSSLSLYQSVINKNNVQRGSGGAMHLTGDNSRILIEQSSISDNAARGDSGGAIYTNGLNTYISITESTINKNSAVKCGALDISNFHHYYIKFKNSVFIDNSAVTKNGGVMCIRNASISVLNSTFSHNRAAENGGVLAVDDSEVIIHGSIFDNNTAGANGGVLNSEYFLISLFISHTSFINNQGAEQGGVMYLGRKGSQVKIRRSEISSNNATKGGFATILGSSLEIATTNIFNNTAEIGEIISACNSDILVSDQLFTATDPIYSVCTLISGDVNDTYDFETTTNTTEALTDTTTTTDIPTITSRPTPETTTLSATTSQPTEPSITSPVHFELKGEAYSNNSVISLSDLGENEQSLMCKTYLVTCCDTLPNQFGEFYYPNGDTVSEPVKKAAQYFHRDRGVQEVRLNRREGITSPFGKFCCAIPDESRTIQNLFIHLLLSDIDDVISKIKTCVMRRNKEHYCWFQCMHFITVYNCYTCLA